MSHLSDLGIQATVSAVVTDPAEEQTMSENEIEAAVESAPADPADPAEAADAAEVEADEAAADEAEAAEVNEDGEPAVAGELFGGADANQAVHAVESEGISEDGIGDF